MSHSVSVTLIADQEVYILGKRVNIHDLCTITLDDYGKIVDASIRVSKTVSRSIVSGETIKDSRGL
jgi:hypothetical protein